MSNSEFAHWFYVIGGMVAAMLWPLRGIFEEEERDAEWPFFFELWLLWPLYVLLLATRSARIVGNWFRRLGRQ